MSDTAQRDQEVALAVLELAVKKKMPEAQRRTDRRIEQAREVLTAYGWTDEQMDRQLELPA